MDIGNGYMGLALIIVIFDRHGKVKEVEVVLLY